MSKTIRILILLMVISSTALALSPTPAGIQTQSIVYHNATIHIGNGEVLENASIAFENGKITRVGHFKMTRQTSDIDLKGKHIYPGFILPNSSLGLTEVSSIKATIDHRETGQNNANVRAIVAYNTDSELPPTLKFNGILLAQTMPQGGLISGLSSVVQLDAWTWQDAAIKIDEGIHVNWPSVMQAKFDFSTFTVKMEKNKDYKKQLEVIKSLFEDAKSFDKNTQVNLKLAAAKGVFEGTRKVYIHTNNSKAIVESISYFQSIGINNLGINNLILVSGQGTEPVIGFIKKSGVPVIVTTVHDLPDQDDRSVDGGYTTAIKLNNAGILVAIGYPGNMGSRNLAFTAGTLVSYGMSKEQALKLITSNVAKILGIDKNYGTLEAGKSATLIVTQGDALDMRGNILLEAYIDGRKLNLDGRQQSLNQRFLNKYDL
ncbi:MAG: amidohydrolase family protein [Proteobacteria bacterium]|nr:amidohydrolase family protein [Pseudomonadota bacterium]